MRRAQELPRAVVGEDTFGSDRGRDQEGIGLVSLRGHARRDHPVDLARSAHEPPSRQMVLEPLDRSGPSAGRGERLGRFLEGEDRVRRKEIGSLNFSFHRDMGDNIPHIDTKRQVISDRWAAES